MGAGAPHMAARRKEATFQGVCEERFFGRGSLCRWPVHCQWPPGEEIDQIAPGKALSILHGHRWFLRGRCRRDNGMRHQQAFHRSNKWLRGDSKSAADRAIQQFEPANLAREIWL